MPDASKSSKSFVGTLIDGRYAVTEEIATGGVGVVYKARRVKLDRIVAVKILHDALLKEPGFAKRFQVEAVALSKLEHPHCVAVLDLGVHIGRPYLVLEFVPGKNVSELLAAQGRFEPRRAIAVTLQILETLEHFHQRSIVHRDLKAENVMLTKQGATSDFVKVLDFGMAKILHGARGIDSGLSNLGIVPGTPSAMAPEQIQQLPPDPRIDIYATGILLYEMVVGYRPFRGADHAQVVMMQLQAKPKPPREILGPGALSAQLEEVILKALEKERVDRFNSAAEMAAALRCVPEAPPVELPTFSNSGATPALSVGESSGGGLLLPKRSGRGRWLAAGAGVLLLLVVLGLRPWASAERALGPELDRAVPGPAAAAAQNPNEPSPSGAEAAPGEPGPAEPPVAEPWRIHRDLAVTYSSQGQLRQAFVEVMTALRDDPAKAAADDALLDVALAWLVLPDGREFAAKIAQSFRDNPRLLEQLVVLTTNTEKTARQHAWMALAAIDELGRVDAAAVMLLDFQQASGCAPIRAAHQALKKTLKPGDTRLDDYLAEVKARDPKDPHVKCLKGGRPIRRPAPRRR